MNARPCIHRFFLSALLMAGLNTVQGQSNGYEENRFSLGFSGSLVFVNPEDVNESFHLINTTEDLALARVNTVFTAGAHIRMSIGPKTYLVFRGEFIQFNRQFQYGATEVSPSRVQTGVFSVSDKRTYSTFPLGLGVGVFLNAQRTIQFEVGAFYAFGMIKESGALGSYGSYESTYDGHGWGGWITVRPVMTLAEWLTFSPEFSGRFLSVGEFVDARGRGLAGFTIDLRGVSIGGSLTFHFH